MSEVYPTSFFQSDDRKIVLSLEVYNRLLGLVNLTEYMTGIDVSKLKHGYEYGGYIYGHVDKKENIYLYEMNKEDNFTVKDGCFDPKSDPKAVEELLENIKRDEINCIVSVHTHPYHVNGTEAGRFYSEPDIEYYKEKFDSSKWSIMAGKPMLMLGCLLTASNDFNPKSTNVDDISFIYYDQYSDSFIHIPNIYVRTNEGLFNIKKDKKLDIITDYIEVDKSTGKVYTKDQIDEKNADNYDEYEIKRTVLK